MRRKAIIIACTFIMLISVLSPCDSAFASEDKVSRIINVVYDDSGSMLSLDEGASYVTNWSQAKYAMEVFAGMLGENDELNIYPMSGNGQKSFSVYGSSDAQERVNKIHNMSAGGGGTPFTPVENAYANLKSNSTKDEKWLVILTDGVFSDVEDYEVQENIDTYMSSCKGLKLAYLTIGEYTTSISANGNNKINLFSADSSDEILSSVTEMANIIFNQLVLPKDYITIQESSITVEFDVPMENIIVFAQGKEINIGDVSQLSKQSEITIKNSEDVSAGVVADENLSGEITNYISDTDDLIPDGKYEIPISNTDNVQVYYKPVVNLNALITKDGTEIDSSNEDLTSGNYIFELQLINPITGDVVESDLFDNMSYETKVTINGKDSTESEKEIEFQVGNDVVTIKSVADMPGVPTLYYDISFSTLIELGEIDLEVVESDTDYHITTLEQEGGFELKVLLDGETIDKELFEKCNFQVNARGIDFDIKKDSDSGTIEVYPKYKSGNINYTNAGKVKISFKIELNEYSQFTNDEEIINIYIEDIPFWDKHGKKIIILFIILFVLYAYLSKAWLPKKLKPNYVMTEGRESTNPERIRVKRNLVSIIAPFVAVKASLRIRTIARIPFTALKIKGNRKNKRSGFLIKNQKAFFQDKSILWDGVSNISENREDENWLSATTGKEIRIVMPKTGIRKNYFEIRFKEKKG